MTDNDDPTIYYLMARYPAVQALADRIDALEGAHRAVSEWNDALEARIAELEEGRQILSDDYEAMELKKDRRIAELEAEDVKCCEPWPTRPRWTCTLLRGHSGDHMTYSEPIEWEADR